MKKHAFVVIVGGGITALMLAQKLREMAVDDVMIVSPELGGLLQSFQKGPYTWDLGGHVYTTQDERVTKLLTRSDPDIQLHERRAFYASGDDLLDESRWIEYPVQSHASDLDLTIAPRPDQRVDSFWDYSVRQLGFEFTEKFMAPFNERVWQVPMMAMDYDWVTGRVQKPSEEKDGWGPNATFYYAQGSRIVEDLLQSAGWPDDVQYINMEVQHVNSERRRLTLEEGLSIGYDFLIWTAPLATQSAGYACSLVVGVPLKTELDVDFHWLYCNLNNPAHRVTLLSRYHPYNAPTGHDSLLIEIPFTRTGGKVPAGLDDVLGAAGLGLNRTDVDDRYIFRSTFFAYPTPLLGTRERITTMKLNGIKKRILFAGRWGSHGYFNVQHIFDDVQAAADQLDAIRKVSFDPPAKTWPVVVDYLTSGFYYKREED